MTQQQQQQQVQEEEQPQQQQQVRASGEPPTPTEDQPHSLPPGTSWEDRILQGKVVIVSQGAEWEQIEPLLRSDLEDFPVLGIDCEWVSRKWKAKKEISS